MDSWISRIDESKISQRNSKNGMNDKGVKYQVHLPFQRAQPWQQLEHQPAVLSKVAQVASIVQQLPFLRQQLGQQSRQFPYRSIPLQRGLPISHCPSFKLQQYPPQQAEHVPSLSTTLHSGSELTLQELPVRVQPPQQEVQSPFEGSKDLQFVSTCTHFEPSQQVHGMHCVHLLPAQTKQLASVAMTQFPLLRTQPPQQETHLPVLLLKVLQRGFTLMQIPITFLIDLKAHFLQVPLELKAAQRGLLTASGTQSPLMRMQPGQQAEQLKGKAELLIRQLGLASTQAKPQRVQPLMHLKQISPSQVAHPWSGGELVGMHCPRLWQQTQPALHLEQKLLLDWYLKMAQLGSIAQQLLSGLKQCLGSQAIQRVPKSRNEQCQKTLAVGLMAQELPFWSEYPTKQELQTPLKGSNVLQLWFVVGWHVSLTMAKPKMHSAHLPF